MLAAAPSPSVESLVGQVKTSNLKHTVEKLASYHTRNTSSKELFEAADWIKSQYEAIPGIKVELMHYEIQASRRVPADKEVVEVIARLPGDDDHLVLVGGHFDSINMVPDPQTKALPDPLTTRAPGANDDGSGTALALEMARIMAQRHWKHTLVFCAFSGEEEGLLGSGAMAARAKSEGWKLDAVLSNDMVGNSSDKEGDRERHVVRVFSDPPDPTKKNPQNSRELARFIEWETRGKVDGGRVKLVLRRDRFGRGGDHTPFSQAGFDAVRYTDSIEEYSRQHTPFDLPESMDFAYLTRNVKLNMIPMAALADAGRPPENIRLDLRQGHHTTLTWKSTPGTKYVVYWRSTESSVWQGAEHVGAVDHANLPQSKDDYFFAVGAEGGVPVDPELRS